MSLGDWGRAEVLLRHVLQVRLNMLGPTYSGTWKCIIKLGKVLSHQKQYSESENLLRIGLQLVEKSQHSNVKYMGATIGHLAQNYSSKRQYEEAQAVCRCAIEALEGSLGPESQSLINLQGRMAWNSLYQGRFEESEAIFRTVVNRSSRKRHENPRYELDFTEGLARTLVKLGRVDEAASWYEKAYSGFAEYYPLASAKLLSVCYRLGQFYQTWGRHDEALKLYEDHVRKMRKTLDTEDLKPDGKSAIEKAQQWLGVREPVTFGSRDYYRRRFGERCGCLG
jgi:tetratricopeptide (TPR) repeat protein